MIYIIPFTNYKTKSLHSEEVILEKFCNSVYMVQNLSFVAIKSYKDFEGTLINDGFSFRRIYKIGYSAFIPILSCKIYEEADNITLNVTIQFHKYVNIGIIIFLLFNILIFTLNLNSIAIIIIPYLLLVYLFNREVKLLKEKFKEIII